jgi:hypothetical protein
MWEGFGCETTCETDSETEGETRGETYKKKKMSRVLLAIIPRGRIVTFDMLKKEIFNNFLHLLYFGME